MTEAPEGKTLQDTSLDRRTLFVRGLPDDATVEDLTDYFSQFVPVKHSIVVRDKDQNSRGFGFVTFTEDEDAVTALAKAKKTKFKNRLLRIDVAKRREKTDRRQRKRKPEEQDQEPEEVEKLDEPEKEEPKEELKEESKEEPEKKKPQDNSNEVLRKTAKIIVRNLPWSVKDPKDLAKLFQRYGKIKDAHIPKKKNGQMCGFGFVTMTKHSVAKMIVEKSVGLEIEGRPVTVDLAIDKSNWESVKDKSGVKQRVDDVEEKSGDKKKKKKQAEKVEDEVEDDAKINFDADAPTTETVKSKKNWQERYSIFVRNLPYDTTKEKLTEHFTKLGKIKYALPVMDKDTGISRGTAFVAFEDRQPYEECLMNAPEVPKDSVLVPDDVSPFYVFEGRVMQVAPAVDRDSAAKLAERHAEARRELLGREPKESDRRNMFLLNEGRVNPNSKLAEVLSKVDMDLREKSYELRMKQLASNPSLHLSMTRLAIRNIPRAMNEKSLKALGRAAIVGFATEAKEGLRHELNKEELERSKKHKQFVEEKLGIDGKAKSKHGVVSQAKIINEVRDSGQYGRSRGYGFLEYKDHRSALMGLRWLNGHEVTAQEMVEGLNDTQKKLAETEGLIKKKRLVVEFAIENANVIKRRFEQMAKSRTASKRKREGETAEPGKKYSKRFERKLQRRK